MTHTPGPWTVGGHPRDNSGTDWREILAPGPFGPGYICQALQDNARLIAAAPDMIAALQVIANTDCATQREVKIAAIARAAIARATGE